MVNVCSRAVIIVIPSSGIASSVLRNASARRDSFVGPNEESASRFMIVASNIDQIKCGTVL